MTCSGGRPRRRRFLVVISFYARWRQFRGFRRSLCCVRIGHNEQAPCFLSRDEFQPFKSPSVARYRRCRPPVLIYYCTHLYFRHRYFSAASRRAARCDITRFAPPLSQAGLSSYHPSRLHVGRLPRRLSMLFHFIGLRLHRSTLLFLEVASRFRGSDAALHRHSIIIE